MVRITGVILGEYGVGKTSLLYGLVGKKIPQDHLPTLMETYCLELDSVQCDGKNQSVELVLTDTPGSDDYHKITQMALVNKDMVLLCFSLADISSYESISNKWITKIRKTLPEVPIILVATKSDLRAKQDEKCTVSKEAVKKKAEEFGAIKYIECCVWNKIDIDQIKETMSTVVSEQIIKKKLSSQSCCIM